MKFLIFVLAASLMLLSQPGTTATAHSQRTTTTWQPAVFKGLTMGKSKRDELIRALGEPKWSETFEDNELPPEEWLHYEGGGDVPGKLVFAVDPKTKTILNLILYPENLKRDAAIKHFGADYKLVRYEFCRGFEDKDSAPVYETPNGQFEHVEYRSTGISVVLQSNDQVHYISYESRFIDSKCRRK